MVCKIDFEFNKKTETKKVFETNQTITYQRKILIDNPQYCYQKKSNNELSLGNGWSMYDTDLSGTWK